MESFPTFWQLREKPIAIFGGGDAAFAKGKLLAKAGARLRFFADKFEGDFEVGAFENADFYPSNMDVFAQTERPYFAIVATEALEKDIEIANFLRQQGILINVVDRPELTDFTIPSIVDRGPLTIGISTNGYAPVLGQIVRQKINQLIPANFERLATYAQKVRAKISSGLPQKERRHFWRSLFDGKIGKAVLAGNEQAADIYLSEALTGANLKNGVGAVAIVGGGPGDPELLTMKAHRLLMEADVILYDNLISKEILDYARRDAKCIYVGKKKSNHSVPQHDISKLLISYASEGNRVVRLKGGDPFIFGRGGEELEAIEAANIPVEVVPGITAATGCGASANIPLTHRDYAQAVTFVTGHAKSGDLPNLDWQALASPNQTIVIYMGVGTAGLTSQKLRESGLGTNHPVAVVENGTTEKQKILRTTLANLPADLLASGIVGPAILVVGEVAKFASGAGLISLLSDKRMSA